MLSTNKAQSPLTLLIITAASVFTVEAVIMLFLMDLPVFSNPYSLMLLDAMLLTVFIVPVLYFSLVRPLGRNIEERIRHEEELERAKEELEVRVSIRTDELKKANETLQQEMVERTQAQAESLKTVIQLEHLLHSVPAIIYSCRIEGDKFIPTYVNCKSIDFMVSGITECLQNPEWWPERIHPDDRKEVFSNFPKKLFDDNELNHEYRFRAKDGSYRWINDRLILVRDENGQPKEVVGSWLDITKRKEQENLLTHLAYHNSLTGLPNKRMLDDRFKQVIYRMKRQKLSAAILFIDLNRLKIINDVLGHSIGDEVLKEVGARLSRCIRTSDTLAHLGGDEFIILFPEISRIEDVSKLVGRVFSALALPIRINENDLTITASIGICICPEDGEDLETLLNKADKAMREAKKEKQNSYHFYTENMQMTSIERIRIEEKLRRAFGNNEFLLHYQPQLDIDKGEITGIEALIRWNDPKEGLIPPGKFITLAEDTGLIIPLGKWIAASACRQNKVWQGKGLNPVVTAINVSKLQFRQMDFVNTISRIIYDTGIDPKYLEIEITESIIMDNTDTTFKLLNQLREIGVRIAIDDFGIGYSSLGYLKSMPIDILKIDQSFVKNITVDEDSRAICHAIISLAESLHIDVIAEGVETMEHLNVLRDLNCKKIQGYFISRPLPSEDVEQFLIKDWRFKADQSTSRV